MKEDARIAADRKTELRLTRRSAAWVLLLLLLPALLFIHHQALNAKEDDTGIRLALDRLFDLSLALVLIGVAFCVGRAVCRRLKLEFHNAAEELSFSALSGSGAIGLGVLLLGLAGGLRPLPVSLLLLLLLGAAYQEIPALVAIIKGGFRAATQGRWQIMLALLFFFLMVTLLVRAATPVHSFDEAIYHLSVAQKFVTQGRVYAVLDNWAGNSPFLIQMIYAVCLLAKADIAAKLFSLLLAALGALALYGFGQRLLSPRAGVLAMFAYFGAGMVDEVAVTARVDIALAAMLFLATYALMVYFESGQSGWLYASAMLAGFSLGIKYTAGIWIALLALLYLVESVRRKAIGFLSIIKRGLIFAMIAATLAAPWFLKNAWWFHNPVYPFVTGEVAEVEAQQVRYFNAEDELRLAQFYEAAYGEDPGLAEFRKQEMAQAAGHRVERQPLKVWEYFTRPDDYNMAEPYHYPNYLFLLVPLALLLLKRRWLSWLALMSAIFFLVVTSTSWVGRILLPVYPALTIISAAFLSDLMEWSEKAATRKRLAPLIAALVIAAVSAAVAYNAYQSLRQAIKEQALAFVSGKLSRRQFMMQQFYYPPLDFINHQLPSAARVMMMGAQMSYGLRRDYLAEVNWDSTEWRRLLARNRSFTEVRDDLKRQGITHILYSDSLFKWVALMGRDNYPNVSGTKPLAALDYQTQLQNWTTFDIFSRNFLEIVYTDQMGFILYQVK
ncbi:MAG: glycosyltransferase family 39 protein [Acidobacteria bacterium]|nr:glycosyltransferase family 39 protein [Acidobacteriota bacterium]